MIVIGKEQYCDFATIQEGIDFLEQKPGHEQKQMMILSGVYEEIIEARLSNFEMFGLGEVKIIGGRHAHQLHEDGKELGTFRTATVFLEGQDIIVIILMIINNVDLGDGSCHTNHLLSHCMYTCLLYV